MTDSEEHVHVTAENQFINQTTDKSNESSQEQQPPQNEQVNRFSFAQIWQQLINHDSVSEGDQNSTAKSDEKDINEKIVILGKAYSTPSVNDPIVENDIYSKIWLTYRTGFEPIPKSINGPQPLSFVQSMIFNKNIVSSFNNMQSFVDNDNFTTDVGWGCMIRTSQSLLANAYQTILLGKEFKYDAQTQNEIHNKILDQFIDTYDSPFSIHNFIRVASESPLQVKPGQWFGPNAASLSIKRLCSKITDQNVLGIPKIEVLISESSDLYDDEVGNLLKNKTSLLILLPVRLGIDSINKIYHSSILGLLSLEQSVGIAGGKPSSSFYFFGYQEPDKLLYLDPHYPQFVKSEYEAFHTKNFQSLNVSDLDPSMMIGILIKDFDDYISFKKQLIEESNKIVHFHENKEVKRTRKPSIGSSKPKENISKKELGLDHGDVDTSGSHDEFISVGADGDNDEFIDLADEFDGIDDIPEETVGGLDHGGEELLISHEHKVHTTSVDANSSSLSQDEAESPGDLQSVKTDNIDEELDDTVHVPRPQSQRHETYDIIDKVSPTQVQVLDDN